ncbi:MAG: prenyltransferase [Chitinophagaceae bacterium]|nr:MAG: prenyltransferase [Chitinophagaceae bacterium]
MPVYWFALSQAPSVNTGHAILVFIILHLLVYPSSNGYNSYMDKDTGSIGGIQHPMAPTRQLFMVSVALDIAAILLSLLISVWFAAGIIAFIAASRAYSYRGIRLKKYPVIGYLTVIIFQGALIYFLVYHGADSGKTFTQDWSAMLGASLLIGAFYPLTQVYQHEQDRADGVLSISACLGYRGTFIFSMIIFLLSMLSLAWYFGNNFELDRFMLMQIFLLPALVYFFWWMAKVFKNTSAANYKNSMMMNLVGSASSNAAFLFILISKHFE